MKKKQKKNSMTQLMAASRLHKKLLEKMFVVVMKRLDRIESHFYLKGQLPEHLKNPYAAGTLPATKETLEMLSKERQKSDLS